MSAVSIRCEIDEGVLEVNRLNALLFLASCYLSCHPKIFWFPLSRLLDLLAIGVFAGRSDSELLVSSGHLS